MPGSIRASAMSAADTALAPPPARLSLGRRFPTLRRLLRHRGFVIGLVISGLVLAVAIFAPSIIDADPVKLSMRTRFRPPGADFFFGTDNFGRSQLARVAYGARLSVVIGLSVVAINAIFGTLLGALS